TAGRVQVETMLEVEMELVEIRQRYGLLLSQPLLVSARCVVDVVGLAICAAIIGLNPVSSGKARFLSAAGDVDIAIVGRDGDAVGAPQPAAGQRKSIDLSFEGQGAGRHVAPENRHAVVFAAGNVDVPAVVA